MEIIPNPILVALQMVPFLVTLAALYYIIFKPMLRYLDEREKVIVEARAEAASLEEQVRQRMDEYEQKLASARAQVTELRRKLRVEAQAEHDRLRSEAQAQSEKQVAEAIARIHAERDAARVDLELTARALAGEISGRVLGRSAYDDPGAEAPTQLLS